MGMTGIFGVVLVVLKLLGKIDWSWWWVTLPFWINIAVLLVMLLVRPLFKRADHE